MGIIFGYTGDVKEPSFKLFAVPNLLGNSKYEIRQYQSYLIAEVEKSRDADNRAFNTLAKYIGVFGQPANIKGEAMAMTAPVIKQPVKLAMTAPVTQTEETMAFVLPFEYTKLEQAPKPTDESVTLKFVPEKRIAVKQFNGYYSYNVGINHFEDLKSNLISDNLISKHDQVEWIVAQYHPPFTLPFFRRNEIWVELDQNRIEVKQCKQL